jgi:dienelactone hydrolase
MENTRAGRIERKQWITIVAFIFTIGLIFASFSATSFAVGGVSTEASSEGIAQTAYSPAKGPGPVVIVISGQMGPDSYQFYAEDLTKLGYYTVLIDGNDILNPEHTGPANLKQTIERALQSPSAIKGKVAVIGFSLGGGGALFNAANMPNLVSMVVAYYPATKPWATKIDSLISHFQVPVLLLAAQRDHHKECCVVETAQAIDSAAKAKGIQFELVVYPEANHGFNLPVGASGEPMGAFRKDDAQDAWRRTVDMLKLYQPLP